MDKRAILINGPPNSGKDTAGIMLRNMLEGKFQREKLIPFRPQLLKFADPLKEAAHALYQIPHSCQYYEEAFGNIWKDTPSKEFFGEKPRDIYIALSELFAKQRPITDSEQFFGHIAARRIRFSKQNNVFIFSDSGFSAESRPVIKEVGISNCLLLTIQRPGTSYANDSRSSIDEYLRLRYPKLEIKVIPNAGNKMLFRIMLQGAMIQWLQLDLD